MDIQITKQNENVLLHRKELNMRVTGFTSTPNRKDVVGLISAKTGASEALIVLDKLEQIYGKKEADAYVKIYDSVENKKRYEPEYKLVRGTKKEEGEKK